MPPDTTTAIEDAARSISAHLGGQSLAILLIGAAARDEITIDADGHILSDLDFLVVLPQTSMMAALLEMRCCRPRLQALRAQLARGPFSHISVGLAPAAPRYWRMATPLMWELRTTARVLHGCAGVKEWPAVRTACQIPRWEAIRLIANRLCELISSVGASAQVADALDRSLGYACVKAGLACSEAALIAAHLYAPTYRERWRRHELVADRFTGAENELIQTAYQVKAGMDTCFHSPERKLPAVCELLLSTLRQFGIDAPHHIRQRAAGEAHLAPGRAHHTCYWVHEAAHRRRVSIRYPITDVYADAYRAAAMIVQHGTGGAMPSAAYCRVAARYRNCPQLVSILPGEPG